MSGILKFMLISLINSLPMDESGIFQPNLFPNMSEKYQKFVYFY